MEQIGGEVNVEPSAKRMRTDESGASQSQSNSLSLVESIRKFAAVLSDAVDA